MAIDTLSPLALAAAAEVMNLDWQDMSNIGQAYGAAAAMFSALAFAAVAVSIAYQVQAVRQQHFEAVRGFQWKLLDMVSDDPETYACALNGHTVLQSPVDLRRRLFTVRLLGYLNFAYNSGFFSEHRLRTEALPGMFASAHSRQFWERSRIHWMGPGKSHMDRFTQIVDDEYRKAVASGPPIEPASNADQPTSSNQATRMRGTAVAVAAGLLLAGWAATRRRR